MFIYKVYLLYLFQFIFKLVTFHIQMNVSLKYSFFKDPLKCIFIYLKNTRFKKIHLSEF